MSMKRKLLLSLLLVSSTHLFAQIAQSLSLGPELALPTKSFGKSNTGWGGSLQYQVKFKGPIGAQLHVGYNQFSNSVLNRSTVSFLPVRAGVVGYVFKDLAFVYADAGISRYSASSSGTKQGDFTWGAGAGYRVLISGKQFAQLSVHYNSHRFNRRHTQSSDYDFNYNWMSIRLAYGISWGKGAKTLGDPLN